MRQFIIGIKNIIRWIPIIYEDRDWDGWYTLKLLETKIKHIRNYTEKRKFYEGWEDEVKWMRVCERILDNVLGNKYWMGDKDPYCSYKNLPNKAYTKYKDSGIIHVNCDVMEHKAEQLFWKILAWKNAYWWD